VFADMLEAQPAPAPRPVEVGRRQGSAEFSRLPAATNRTADLRALNPSMPFRLPCRHRFLAIGTHLYRADDRDRHRTRRQGVDRAFDRRAETHTADPGRPEQSAYRP